ncbi:MAG: YfcE family phosphodiesterase [Treponema sp.]|nr:YfcE family phosphodiesterase [Treponema sp.]
MEVKNLLIQSENFLLGGDEAVESLSEKDSASIAIVSDSHGSSADLLSMVKNAGACDALFFCGDGISDLSSLVGTALRSTELQSLMPPVIAFVQGNNDLANFVLKNPETGALVNVKVPSETCVKVAGHKILLTHGHKFGIYAGLDGLRRAARLLGMDVVLFGHTHIASYSSDEGLLLLNPGSIALPRENQPKCYAKMYLERGKPASDFAFFQLKGNGDAPFKTPVLLG